MRGDLANNGPIKSAKRPSLCSQTHTDPELAMVVEGDVELEIDGWVHRDAAGEEPFIPARARHTVRNLGRGQARSRAFHGRADAQQVAVGIDMGELAKAVVRVDGRVQPPACAGARPLFEQTVRVVDVEIAG